MSYQHEILDVITAADGSATAFTATCDGELDQIRYVKTDYADGSTFTITLESTGDSVWTETGVNASTSRAPRQPTHTALGVLIAGWQDNIISSHDRFKIVIANGGNAKKGTFHFILSFT